VPPPFPAPPPTALQLALLSSVSNPGPKMSPSKVKMAGLFRLKTGAIAERVTL
jgi:hypothetical protein